MKFKNRKEYLDFCRADNQQYIRSNKYLLVYLRDNKKRPRAAVLAYLHPTENVLYIGWSLCRKTDSFCKVEAVNRAARRAVPLLELVTPAGNQRVSPSLCIPHSLVKLVYNVAELARLKLLSKQKIVVNTDGEVPLEEALANIHTINNNVQSATQKTTQHAAGHCVINRDGRITEYIAQDEEEEDVS
jgi:hypothetical protein